MDQFVNHGSPVPILENKKYSYNDKLPTNMPPRQ